MRCTWDKGKNEYRKFEKVERNSICYLKCTLIMPEKQALLGRSDYRV